MSYISSEGLSWRGVLKGFPKATNIMQPLFEAFTNSLEAIDMRKRQNDTFLPYIHLNFYFNHTTENENDGLTRLSITDNGIGFDNENFNRLKVFKDDSKGDGNKGSGRIQFIQFFITATYESIYSQDGTYKLRRFVLSKAESFLRQNSILRLDKECELDNNSELKTTLLLDDLRAKVDAKFFNGLEINDIKEALLDHYILYFCVNRTRLPEIVINYYHGTNLIATRKIDTKDIPEVSHEDETINVPLSQISSDMKRVETSTENIEVNIKSFRLPYGQLKKNSVKITCKGEVVDSVKVKLDCLPLDMQIGTSVFLFLLSSKYFDERIGDSRDTLEILNRTEFKKRAKQHGRIEPQIVMDDLQAKVSVKAEEMYPEISEQKKIHAEQLATLKQTYMLSEEALAETDVNDSVEDILKKAYIYDAKLIAERDAAYHSMLERLNQLDTSAPAYRTDLERLVTEMAKAIPLQDKESLSRYVTHRKLVLDLMAKILHRETNYQNIEGARNIDEKLLHNLLFTQHSYDVCNSDLWMLNEDYLYFRGVSDQPLNQIKIDGVKLFREEVTEEEERYLLSLGENRRIKRPDILLFPSERKCIIIELKTPETNLALHVNQIKRYANLLRNFTSDCFMIDTFYGYLIGEALEPKDIRAVDGYFKYDPKFNFMYLPSTPIVYENDPTGRQDGSLYMEVISYSEILRRAEKRNEAFISKLFPQKVDSEEQNTQQEDSELTETDYTLF